MKMTIDEAVLLTQPWGELGEQEQADAVTLASRYGTDAAAADRGAAGGVDQPEADAQTYYAHVVDPASQLWIDGDNLLRMWREMPDEEKLADPRVKAFIAAWNKSMSDALAEMEADTPDTTLDTAPTPIPWRTVCLIDADGHVYNIHSDDAQEFLHEFRTTGRIESSDTWGPKATGYNGLAVTREEIDWTRFPNYYYDAQGNLMDYDAAVKGMDDDLREELHRELSPCTNQRFIEEYARRHQERFNEAFIPYHGGAW